MNHREPDDRAGGAASESARPAAARQHQLVEERFGRTALEWQEIYTRPRLVRDLVLADRKRWAVEYIRRFVEPGARILDAGCGAGLTALDLVRSGYAVHGVDIAQPMIDLALRAFRDERIPPDRYAFTCAELERAALPEGTFGGIVALGFLQYQEEEVPVLRLLRRLLIPGGTLVVTGPTEIRLSNYLGIPLVARRALEWLRLVPPKTHPGRVGRHKYSIGRFRRLLHAAAFGVLESRGHGFAEFEYVGRLLGHRGEFVLHQALSRLARVVPIHRWGNDLIVVARRLG